MKRILLVLFITAVSLQSHLFAQEAEGKTTEEKVEEVKGQVEGMNETLLEMKSTLDALKKIKLSGYIQAQFQSAKIDGAKSFAGGDFSSTLHNRFLLRRGRLKVNYDNDLTQYVVQIDITQGGLATKDAYVSVKEPWLKAFSLTGGIFDRPFGFEISYSSSSRETPERTRLFQTLFPGERDLGAKVEYASADGPLSFLNVKAGLFTGNGIGAETDNAKDFIGRVGFQLPFADENFEIDGGVSAYVGKVRLDDGKKQYKLDNTTLVAVDSITRYINRNYIGFDAQLYYDLPVLGGFSLRAEYITGSQPGTSSSSSAYKVASGDVYARNFYGYYINYIQNIGLQNQFLLKYDVYDPNKDVTGSQIGAAGVSSKFNSTDVKYSTLGLGWIYHWDSNVKFVFYYDMVKNETVASTASGSLVPFKADLKDNVLTCRVQYKF
jgi:hypothetical protein